MADKKKITLREAAREFEVSMGTIYEILTKASPYVENDPEYILTLEDYSLLTSLYQNKYPGESEHETKSPERGKLPYKLGEEIRDEEQREKCTILSSGRIENDIDVSISLSGSVASQDSKHLQVDIEIPDHLTDDEARKYVKEVLLKLDEMHRDFGGHGLKVRDLQVLLQEKLKEVLL